MTHDGQKWFQQACDKTVLKWDWNNQNSIQHEYIMVIITMFSSSTQGLGSRIQSRMVCIKWNCTKYSAVLKTLYHIRVGLDDGMWYHFQCHETYVSEVLRQEINKWAQDQSICVHVASKNVQLKKEAKHTTHGLNW